MLEYCPISEQCLNHLNGTQNGTRNISRMSENVSAEKFLHEKVSRNRTLLM